MKNELITRAAIQVYSMDFGMKCVLLEKNNAEVVVRLSYGKCDMIRKNEPVVFMYLEKELFECRSAIVTQADYKECTLRLLIADDFEKEERRIFERYPVSIEASARKKYQSKRLNMLVKNMSLYGLGVLSDTDIDVDELIDIDLITKKNMFYFSARIVWKKLVDPSESLYEYGIHITDIDVATLNILDDYLKKLRVVYMDMLEKSR